MIKYKKSANVTPRRQFTERPNLNYCLAYCLIAPLAIRFSSHNDSVLLLQLHTKVQC